MTVRFNALTFLVLAVGLAGTWALLAFAGPRDDDPATTLLRALWAALPYGVLGVTARHLARTPVRQLVVLAGAAGTALTGIAVLVHGFVLRPGPTAAADSVLLPAYQLVLAVAVLLVVSVLSLRRPVPRV